MGHSPPGSIGSTEDESRSELHFFPGIFDDETFNPSASTEDFGKKHQQSRHPHIGYNGYSRR